MEMKLVYSEGKQFDVHQIYFVEIYMYVIHDTQRVMNISVIELAFVKKALMLKE